MAEQVQPCLQCSRPWPRHRWCSVALSGALALLQGIAPLVQAAPPEGVWLEVPTRHVPLANLVPGSDSLLGIAPLAAAGREPLLIDLPWSASPVSSGTDAPATPAVFPGESLQHLLPELTTTPNDLSRSALASRWGRRLQQAAGQHPAPGRVAATIGQVRHQGVPIGNGVGGGTEHR